MAVGTVHIIVDFDKRTVMLWRGQSCCGERRRLIPFVSPFKVIPGHRHLQLTAALSKVVQAYDKQNLTVLYHFCKDSIPFGHGYLQSSL
jgi:hypothetical protein